MSEPTTPLEFCSDLAAHYEQAIRAHRDKSHGSQRCWQNDEELWAALPEGYTPPALDHKATLAQCEAFLAHCHNPAVQYVDPQAQITALELQVADLRQQLAQHVEEKALIRTTLRGHLGTVKRLVEQSIEIAR